MEEDVLAGQAEEQPVEGPWAVLEGVQVDAAAAEEEGLGLAKAWHLC